MNRTALTAKLQKPGSIVCICSESVYTNFTTFKTTQTAKLTKLYKKLKTNNSNFPNCKNLTAKSANNLAYHTKRITLIAQTSKFEELETWF